MSSTRKQKKPALCACKMCGQFLESALTSAKLPAPVTDRIRKQFAGKLFEAEELTEAIEDAREMVSQLTGGAAVQGPRIHQRL